MPRGAAALYLLGRLRYKPAIETILPLIAQWEHITPEEFAPDEFLSDAEEVRFQYLSQAIVAAMEIALAHPETRARTDAVIHGVIDAPTLSIHSTLKMMIKGMAPIKYEMAPMLRNAVQCLTQKRREAEG